MLQELLDRLGQLPPKQLAQVVKETMEATKSLKWIPNPGPQTQGYYCQADVLLFGGNPGGGKTALELGVAFNCHHRTLFVRKAFTDLEGVIDTAKKLVGDDEGFVGGMRPKYRKPDGGVIHFAGLTDGGLGGKQGTDHDLICVDEAAQVPEDDVRMLLGWLRTDRKGQRCRMILASNPPLDSTGDWLIAFFAPWLDETYPNPANPGELRYFLPDENGKDRECERDDTTIIGGVTIGAQSRSFIPSKFTDNPFYTPEDYAKSLAGLPASHREILISGNFMLARKDQHNQVIPTAWVKAAQLRWTSTPPAGVPMCSMGVDASGGGDDPMVIAPRHDGWFAPLIVTEGHEIPEDRSGRHCAGVVMSHRMDDATVIVDMGGGYGGPMYEQLIENIGSKAVMAHKGAEASVGRTNDRKFGFFNKRSEAIWKFREALDPGQPGGSPIALPPDHMLVSDLTAPTFEITSRGYKVESKENVCERLKRSTDRGDAVEMAWAGGLKMAQVQDGKFPKRGRRGKDVKVNLGRFATRRH